MDKNFFREEVKRLRSSLSKQERREESEVVCKRVTELEEYVGAKKILSFMNFGTELEIEILNEKIIRLGKRLYLPRVEKDGQLSIIEYGKGFELGQFGIREPIGERYEGDLDLIITPGLAFDREGNRIGYGKGYYDRLFSKYSRVLKIAPIFDFQLFPKISTEEFDVKIDMIITKNEILKIKNY